jgi:cobalt/nickel transport system ATP-binding protein
MCFVGGSIDGLAPMSLRPKDEATLAAAPKLLEFEQVAYTYPSGLQSSITSLSLRLPRGSRCGLIGENGCGKTTLFLLAHGLLRPQSGRILWHGKPFSYCREGLSNLRQRIGLVFQNPEHQLVATTVAEDLSYGLVNLGLTDEEIRSRIQTIAHSFDLGDLLDRQVHSLSLGQKKQLSLADVMVLEPELLLMDEPTAFLSPGHCIDLRHRLNRIHAAGTTVMVATHDLEFLNGWADWLFVMDRGQLVMEGRPVDVFSQQQHLEELNLGIPPTLELLADWRQLAKSHLNLPPAQLEMLERKLRP